MSIESLADGSGLDDALARVLVLEEQVRHRALHDPLTGLPNRLLFVDRVHHALALAGRKEATVGVIFLDLDRFKLVNDTLGHHRGDELLTELARRLEPLVRSGDTLARLGGDEFAVLCEDLPGERGAIEVAQRVLDALSTPVAIEDRPVFAGVSIGIAVADGRSPTAESLVRDADVAMCRAKEQGGGRYELFDPAMRSGWSSASRSRRTCAWRWSSSRWSSSTNRWSRSSSGGSSGSRRWCAGATRRAGSSCRAPSCRSPRRAG